MERGNEGGEELTRGTLMIDQLAILSENLDNKISVLESIKEYNVIQNKMLSVAEIDIDDFNVDLDKKEKLIQKLEELDEGFDEIYRELEDQIQSRKEMLGVQIRSVQKKIARINELSTEINELEASNKNLITSHIDKIKASIKQGRQGAKAAYGYYQNMSGGLYNKNQIMDSKF